MNCDIKNEMIKTNEKNNYPDNQDLISITSLLDDWDSFSRMIVNMKIKRLSDTKAIIWEADGRQTNTIECLKGNYDGLLYSLHMLDEGDWIIGLDYADVKKTLFNEYYNENWKDVSKHNNSFKYYYMEWRNILKDGDIKPIEDDIKNALKQKNKKIVNMVYILCGDFKFSTFVRYGKIMDLLGGNETGWGQGCLQKDVALSLHVFLWCK